MKPRIAILNGTFDPCTRGEAVDAVFEAIDAGRRGWFCTVNVSTLMTMRADPTLQSFVDRAAFVVADGQPLVWCAPLFGGSLPERVTGIDLIDVLCARAVRDGRGVYLLGATGEVLGRTLERLRLQNPGLRIAGSDGYFRATEAPARADAIRRSGASILLVGMGSPRQEVFIEQQWERLGATIAIGVGGSFDVIAGLRMRAHPMLGRLGMEWAVRLAQEPRRLMRRYAVTNKMFCVLIMRTLIERWAKPRG